MASDDVDEIIRQIRNCGSEEFDDEIVANDDLLEIGPSQIYSLPNSSNAPRVEKTERVGHFSNRSGTITGTIRSKITTTVQSAPFPQFMKSRSHAPNDYPQHSAHVFIDNHKRELHANANFQTSDKLKSLTIQPNDSSVTASPSSIKKEPIHVNNFGEENMSVITLEYIKTLLDEVYRIFKVKPGQKCVKVNIAEYVIPKIINKIYGNKECRENINCCISSDRDEFAFIKTPKGWNKVPYDLVDHIIKYRAWNALFDIFPDQEYTLQRNKSIDRPKKDQDMKDKLEYLYDYFEGAPSYSEWIESGKNWKFNNN